VGRVSLEVGHNLRTLVAFTGQLTVTLFRAAAHPHHVRWRDMWHAAELAGVNAIPIVALIGFLLGLIMAFQSAIPMRRFGADIFVANLIGLSMLRELGPLVTAILLAGRSGSAFAAELGTMKVREEIDALSTMGLDPVRFLGGREAVFDPLVGLHRAVDRRHHREIHWRSRIDEDSPTVRPAAEASPPGKQPPTPGAAEDDDEDDEAQDGRPNWKRVRERHQKRDKVSRRRRQFAAVAMDHAARDAQLEGLVRFMLRRWRRSDDPALRWTAACAYGYDLGARDAAAAFDELRVLGTPDELRPSRRKFKPEKFFLEESVFHASGEAMANMFGSGAHREVLAVLHEWSVDSRWSLRLLALQAVICLIPRMAATIGTPEVAGAHVGPGRTRASAPLLDAADREERARWPILIALHGRHPELQRQGAELVRFGLRSRGQKTVLSQFEDIYFIAEDYPETALPAVEAFLPLVITEESDRGGLLGLLHRMRDAWADPLSPDIADRLEEVIRGVSVVTGKKVFS